MKEHCFPSAFRPWHRLEPSSVNGFRAFCSAFFGFRCTAVADCLCGGDGCDADCFGGRHAGVTVEEEDRGGVEVVVECVLDTN